VSSDGLDVETTYGKGNVLVKFEDVTSLRTDAPFVVVTGDVGKVRGRLLGVRDGLLLVGEDEATAQALAPDTLFPSVTQEKWDSSSLTRAKAQFRYWNAKYDMTFAATQATTDTLAFQTGFEVERRKRPTRFLTTGSFRYGTTHDNDTDGDSTTKNENELLGTMRGEYDFTKRIYSFAQGSAEYDEVESLSLRAVPRGGLGYRIIDQKDNWWTADVGPGWVYERFFGGSRNRYATIAFGTECAFALPFDVTFTCRGEYLPAVDDWKDDYLLRGSAGLAFPMTEWLSFTTNVTNTYDNTPAEDTERNSLTTTAGLSLVF
jgi:hypothetical protein